MARIRRGRATQANSHSMTRRMPPRSKKTGVSRRRLVFKNNYSPAKAPTAVSTPVTAQSLFYKGVYFTVGDVVNVLDIRGGIYYAQIRGLLQDQYLEKSAVLTWLLPTQSSPIGRFDPTTYFLGPEDEMPRKLECLEFECHVPIDYYKQVNSPYPTIPIKPETGFIWTRIGPKIVTLPYKKRQI